MNVYMNEYNVKMGDMSYLPLVSGLLRASAEQNDFVKKHYKFKPFIYSLDSPENILDKYDEKPDVAAFSLSMWNEQLNLQIASTIKAHQPSCLIIFGGPQVPHYPIEYMKKYPFIDICVKAEGELAFTEILERFHKRQSLNCIPDVTWSCDEGILTNGYKREFSRDLDTFPSPYLEGLYDELVETAPFQAIIETNRGCPFHCTFCYWGRGGLSRKYKYHGLDRVYKELEWCAEHKIKYIFNADSNFGMNKRDTEIADFLVDLKGRTGYPDKFRTCYGKNTDDKIFKIGALFHKHNLEKGITLARQSNDPTVLKNIKRGNISMETYKSLQERFNSENIPIYSELILGLPGETVESWKQGIGELLDAGLKNQLFVYFCQVYPNTDLGEKEYQEEFGLIIIKTQLNEIHGNVRGSDWIPEYEEIVVGQDSMSTSEWREMAKLSWVTMLMHSLKLGYFIMEWLYDRFKIPHIEFLNYLNQGGHGEHFIFTCELTLFDLKLDAILAGEGRGEIVEGCGGIYWDVEEASFLRCMEDKDLFYLEFYTIVCVFLGEKNINFYVEELSYIVEYQKSRIPTKDDFNGDLEKFARETILWARKSGTMLKEEIK